MCIISYDKWQFECCGEHFKIGDMIEWEVVKLNCANSNYNNIKNRQLTLNLQVDYIFDNHLMYCDMYDSNTIKGNIKTIQILSKNNKLVYINSTDEDKNNNTLEYIVTLKNVNISNYKERK